jgi:hypothetical protein
LAMKNEWRAFRIIMNKLQEEWKISWKYWKGIRGDNDDGKRLWKFPGR